MACTVGQVVEREMEVVREQSAQIWKQLMECEDQLAV